ncbi:hypothetical protein [Agreia sp. COWG]|uniref:hypothetical protein n=1 Tax=Agreia sp. COWG TaxID=2773266 RepID=UPI0019273BEE|nr:hypothetical protein [Agreia sp. COWG]CAD5999368.1 protein of unknown function [Agreia sp. COWG]
MTDTNTTPALAEAVIHECPTNGSSAMPCCGLLPFEVPTTDRITVNADQVTCGALTAEDWQIWHAIHEHRELQARAAKFWEALYEDIGRSVEAATAAFTELYRLFAEKPSKRRARMKRWRNEAEYSQPWAPGALKKKRSRR